MKKKIYIGVSAVIIMISLFFNNKLPIIFATNISILNSLSINNSFPEHLISNELNKEPEGIIGYVTYYGQREGSKEILDIYLDSQTLYKDDDCFLMVSVYSSDGDLEYRLNTTYIQFSIAMHYKIEIDPPKKENETYREVRIAATFYSNENDRHQYLTFNIDYKEPSTFIYEEDIAYTSNYPVTIKYKLNGEIEKIYESLKFNNICNSKFHKPIFDISKMNLTYTYKRCEIYIPNYDECYLLIDKLYDTSDLEEENEMKKIPLNLVYLDGIVSFELKDKYYYDSSDGMIYKNDKSGRSEINSLILPSTFPAEEEAIYYELHFTNFTSSGDEIVFKSYASFDIKWFGICGESYFCIESKEDLLEDAYYSGGIAI